jgi:hypothetical protein
MIKVEYFGEKSLESSKKSVSKGGAVAPTSSAVDPPLVYASIFSHGIIPYLELQYISNDGHPTKSYRTERSSQDDHAT